MYILFVFFFFFLLLWLIYSYHTESFDIYSDNTLRDPSVSGEIKGNTTINGDLTITGNIKCGNKITLGNGHGEWNMETNLWQSALSFYSTNEANSPPHNVGGGKLRGHGRVMIGTSGDIWSAVNDWTSIIKNDVLALKNVKTISKRVNQSGGDVYRTISFGYTFYEAPTLTTTLEKNKDVFVWSHQVVSVTTDGFRYRLYHTLLGNRGQNYIMDATDDHTINYTAVGIGP